jgi:hypothetical protein
MALAALAAMLVALSLAACGGGGDSGSTASEGTAVAQEAGSNGESSSNGGAKDSGEASKAGSGEGNSGSGGGNEGSPGSGGGSEHFVPKPHHDSGGGSAQYRVKGGDNSIQEFGSEVEGSEFEEAAAALHGFLDARAAGDWGAACSYMSKGVVESFKQLAAQSKQAGSTSCASILEALTNPAAKQAMQAEADQANVGSLRTEGERAFLIYTGYEKTVFAMPMAQEDGGWKVASLAGTPLS